MKHTSDFVLSVCTLVYCCLSSIEREGLCTVFLVNSCSFVRNTTTMATLAKNSSELAFITEESAVSPGAISSGRISGRSSISSSPSSRKRVHPTSLNIDDETPPNKRLPTPTVSNVTCTVNTRYLCSLIGSKTVGLLV